MTQERDQARRRTAALGFFAGIAVALALPGPRAKIELTTAGISVFVESGSVRFRTGVIDSAQAVAKPIAVIVRRGLLGE